jgi:hypothetical protein
MEGASPTCRQSVKIEVDASKSKHLEQLSKMNEETLRILADLSLKPGIEKKLKDNKNMIKMFL